MFHWWFRRVFDNITWSHYRLWGNLCQDHGQVNSKKYVPFSFEYFFLRLYKGYVLNLIEDKYQNNCLPPLLINMWPKYLWKPSDESIVVDSPKLVVQLGPGRERPYLQNKLVGRPPRWKWFRGKRTFLSDLLSKLWKGVKVFLFLDGTLYMWRCHL